MVLPVFVKTFVWLSRVCHTTQTQFQHIWIARSAFGDIFRDGQEGVVCYLFPGRRSREGEEGASLKVIAFHSHEEEDSVLKKRKTFSFSLRGILPLFHSQEKEDFDFYILKKRKTSFHQEEDFVRFGLSFKQDRTLAFLWLQRQVRSSLKKSKAVKTTQLC